MNYEVADVKLNIYNFAKKYGFGYKYRVHSNNFIISA